MSATHILSKAIVGDAVTLADISELDDLRRAHNVPFEAQVRIIFGQRDEPVSIQATWTTA